MPMRGQSMPMGSIWVVLCELLWWHLMLEEWTVTVVDGRSVRGLADLGWIDIEEVVGWHFCHGLVDW